MEDIIIFKKRNIVEGEFVFVLKWLSTGYEATQMASAEFVFGFVFYSEILAFNNYILRI
ncbi:hypothetical protein MsAc7_17500 [Methanolapillus millepedarum]|uniref:Uncharacterized protein n=1 Tax=Methanolapillus millepedarum TaxID=3028296 RepID=A0AA96VGM3_9EURY|nr:hypothetical protein MsAc7_17500 [Methanosarcinaceae archaeon Ac7]